MTNQPVTPEMNKLFQAGLRAYQKRDFFEAHEQWETLWSDYHPPQRSLIQGLIQLAVSFVHVENGNLTGARNLIAKAQRKLANYAGIVWDLNVDALKQRLSQTEEHLHAIDSPEIINTDFIPELTLNEGNDLEE